MEMMISSNSSFLEDQNRPKYNQIWSTENVFLNYKPTCAYLIRAALNQIGHPWKAINTSDLNLIWTSSWDILLLCFMILAHTGLRQIRRGMGAHEGEIARSKARIYVLGFWPQSQWCHRDISATNACWSSHPCDWGISFAHTTCTPSDWKLGFCFSVVRNFCSLTILFDSWPQIVIVHYRLLNHGFEYEHGWVHLMDVF